MILAQYVPRSTFRFLTELNALPPYGTNSRSFGTAALHGTAPPLDSPGLAWQRVGIACRSAGHEPSTWAAVNRVRAAPEAGATASARRRGGARSGEHLPVGRAARRMVRRGRRRPGGGDGGGGADPAGVCRLHLQKSSLCGSTN